MAKITIIGAGKVGATIAYTLSYAGIASEIVLIDIDRKRAEGEAIDIRQGTPFCPPCSIYAGDYEDANDSDIVIITSGIARKPGQTRLDLTQVNVDIIRQITPQIVKHAPEATYIIVSNPVDILTYAFCRYAGIPEERIIGSGTILDTARLRSRLADHFHINQQNIHACVLGEHGESSFIPWSIANFANIPVLSYPEAFSRTVNPAPRLDIHEVEEYVRHSGSTVIELKGATYYAVSISVCHICKCLLSRVDSVLTVSTMMHGEYGIDDVCLSVLCTLGMGAVHGKPVMPLTSAELAALRYSANCLKDVIKVTNF